MNHLPKQFPEIIEEYLLERGWKVYQRGQWSLFEDEPPVSKEEALYSQLYIDFINKSVDIGSSLYRDPEWEDVDQELLRKTEEKMTEVFGGCEREFVRDPECGRGELWLKAGRYRGDISAREALDKLDEVGGWLQEQPGYPHIGFSITIG